MYRGKIKALLSCIALSAFVLGACNENDDNPIDPGDTNGPTAPSGLMALSMNNAIKIRWNAPTVAVAGYRIVVTPTPTQGLPTIAAGDTTAVISGLTNGARYTISLQAQNSAGLNSASSSVEWAPALRFNGIKLYGSSSSQGSGVQFTNSGAVTQTVANGGTWDLTFDDKTSGSDRIASPGQSGYVNDSFLFPNGQSARITRISQVWNANSGGLDMFYDSSIDTTRNTTNGLTEAFFEVGGTRPNGYIFYFRTQDGNVGKAFVRSTGSSIVQTDGNGRFVTLDVSYNPVPNIPYAVREIARRGALVERIPVSASATK